MTATRGKGSGVNAGDDDVMSTAVDRAQAGEEAWRSVVRQQRTAQPDHGDFYALAAEITQTLRALESLAGLLPRQVTSYGVGRVLYDDAGCAPATRLAEADAHLTALREALAEAEVQAQRFWSAIGHIGVSGDAPVTREEQ